jgi:hypothetical protein
MVKGYTQYLISTYTDTKPGLSEWYRQNVTVDDA